VSTPAPQVDLTALHAGILGTVFEGRVVLRDEVGSTIDACRQLSDDGAPEGTTVIALAQTAGRGQHGHAWFSPRGGALYLSALLRPALRADQVPVLACVAGLAGWLALARDFGVPVTLRVPNDLVVPDRRADAGGAGWRKLAGLLVDTSLQGDGVRHAIVSIGVNVTLDEEDFPPGLRGLATSLLAETGVRHGIAEVAAAFLRRLDALRPPPAGPATDGYLRDVHARHAAVARELPDLVTSEAARWKP
jgi:BirA family biotin operon repressor/biotin-[acetyl-CoA-carboxylase] ligase